MSDNILSAILTFSLLAGGTVAIGSEIFGGRQAAITVATLPVVTVAGHRAAVADAVTLPMVMVTGRRQNGSVAVAANEGAPRVE
ncbi:MAG: hypothetical protein ABI364_03180 [Caldimonas sp.]